jgi:putative phage-type endonuclease
MNLNSILPLKNIFSEFDSVLLTDICTTDICTTDTSMLMPHRDDIISITEIVSLYESMIHIIDECMINNIFQIKKIDFEDQLKDHVIHNIELFIEGIYLTSEHQEYIRQLLDDIYLYARKEYFTSNMPPRAYRDTFIRKIPNCDKMSIIIDEIRNKPQPEQRTDAWYLFRYNLLTASSIWKAFGSQSMKNQLIYEKCVPLNVDKYKSVNLDSPLHHGQKYEELSIMYYEHIYGTKVEDFGCIQHDKYNYIGASPDGINVDPKSNRYGRMLEIKNTVSREITGIPKEEYWIQMQVQMETCGLNECDFLETQFTEYESYEEFVAEPTNCMKGVILCFMENGKPLYKYMPICITKLDEIDEWGNNIIDLTTTSRITWVNTQYWKLNKVSCILVLRNKEWFKRVRPEIEEIWNYVINERITGYDHRAPKKMSKKNEITISTENKSICLLDNMLFSDKLS